MIALQQGDAVIVDLDGATGHETKNDPGTGCRPCVVVQNDRENQVSPYTIIAPITDIAQFKRLPVQVAVTDEKRGPLHKDSTVECGQLRTID